MKKRSATAALLALGGAIAAGTLLFWTSQSVQRAEDRLENLTRAVANEEQAIRVLNAEWAYLNRPDRLEDLAVRYLDLTDPAPAAAVLQDVSALPDPSAPVIPPRKPAMEAQPAMLRAGEVDFRSMTQRTAGEGTP